MSAAFSKNSGLFKGCDFTVKLKKERKNTPIRLLQLTDMQVIDSSQQRTPNRLRQDEIDAWVPDRFMGNCGNHIASLIAQTNPDLIFITGDIVYGQFDDNGTVFEWFCSFMDSFKIPWAPVFGNHDNESAKGVDWQCERLENSEYCLFKRGTVTGNGNYTVGIAADNELLRVLHMTDSNGCICNSGIYQDQLELIMQRTDEISASQGKAVPAFMAFHIPTESFAEAERAKAYKTDEKPFYTIGVDVKPKHNDFGFCYESYDANSIKTECNFIEFLNNNNIDGVFAGHWHKVSTCISYKNIRFVFGLKTGQYDYHLPGSIGGTLVTLRDNTFDVNHIPSAVPYAPMPKKAPVFNAFFTD